MAVQFSADNQAYTASTGLPGSTYTALAWVYLTTNRLAISTIWVHDAGGTNGHSIETTADGTTLSANSAGGSFNAGSLTAGSWHKVAFVVNGTTGTIYSAAEGAALAATGSGTISAITPTALRIGAFTNATSGHWLNGRVADFKVYNAVLAQTEMEAEFTQFTPVRTTNLLRYHPFRVAELTDYSGNGNTLTAGTGATTAADPPIPGAVGQPYLVADRGTVANVTAATTSAVALTAPTAIAVGDYLVARVAVDNSGASGAAPGCTVTDPRSNVWTVLGPALVDPGAAAAGATAYLCYARVGTAYQAADSLTFNWGGISTTAKAIVVEQWDSIHQVTPVAVAAVTATGTASTAVTAAITPTTPNQLVYTCLATEGIAADTFTGDADTTSGTWATLTTTASADATATNNQRVMGQYKVVSAAGAQSWDATITSRDWAAIAVVFAPDEPPPPRVFVRPGLAATQGGSW